MKPVHRIDLIAFAALAGVTVLGYLGGIKPIIQSHAEAVLLRSRVNNAEEAVKAGQSQERALMQAIQSYEDELRSRVVVADLSSASNARLSKLAELAQVCGIELEAVRPGERRTEARFEALPVRLSGRGALPDAIDFVSRLKTVFPDFGVRRLTIEQNDGTSARLAIDVTWFTARAGGDDPAG